jgi:luciferase family oxidoreductase group 1
MGQRKPVRYSILDLSPVVAGGTPGGSFRNTLDLARHAERWGYHRFWLAEHHGIPGVASAATAVLVGHVAGGTASIRVGSGGVMLPNHAPLVIAEQFGTLATLHPDRIDLGLGRAPGTDQVTLRALRVHPADADDFPRDVLELQGYLGDASLVETVAALPGKGTHVPLYILGSSLFGARLAAKLGLPYAFASHFAPTALDEAIALYRRELVPSEQSSAPYVIAGVNVIASDTADDAREQLAHVRRARARTLLGRGPYAAEAARWTDEEVDELLASPAGRQVAEMMKFTVAGTAADVKDYVETFARRATADEVIVVHPSSRLDARLRSVELLASA